MCGRKRLDRAWSEASSVIEALGRSECGVGVEWGSPSSFKLTPSADLELSISSLLDMIWSRVFAPLLADAIAAHDRTQSRRYTGTAPILPNPP